MVVVQTEVAGLGVGLLALGVLSDRFGIGSPGFGPVQTKLIFAGLGLVLASFVFRWKPMARRIMRHGRAVIGGSLSVAILGCGLFVAELYSRYVQGYLLFSWPLHFVGSFELDRLKIFNRGFLEQNPGQFERRPFAIEAFEGDRPQPMYVFKPNLRMALRGKRLVRANEHEEPYWSSNSWGFRGPEFTPAKPPGTIRIVCLGGSVTEGSFGDRETYPYLLERELERRFPGQSIEVINAGHHAMGTDDLLAILRQRVLPLRPDVLIFYEAHNDLAPLQFTGELPCNIGDAADCWLLSYPALYRWLHRRSAMFVLISRGLGWSGRRPPPMAHSFEERPSSGASRAYKENLRQIVKETLQQGTHVVLSSYVSLATPGLEVTHSEKPRLFEELYHKWYPFTAAEIAQMYKYYNDLSREVAREVGVPYADVTASFPREERYFPVDLVHPNGEGNGLLASLFAEFLAREVLPGLILEQGGEAAAFLGRNDTR